MNELNTQTRVVVIGGGIIGCSVAYHLAAEGCGEVMLIEKSELTAGSTWHAAGQVAFYADSLIHSRLQKESFDFYAALEKRGRPVGQHACGSLRLALHDDQMREFKRFSGRARALDIDHDIIDANAARRLFPLLETREIVGALHIPNDGFVDPNMTTQAIAAEARQLGATVERFTEVTQLELLATGEWRVETNRGVIRCEHVVNCAGFWGPELSAMLGFELPVVAVEDQYLITDEIPEVASFDGELPILREMSTPFYLRQERAGLMVSCYESEPVFWGLDGIPKDFGRELLADDLERAAEKFERTTEFVPALSDAGVKTIVNGPLGRTPDVVGLLGPAHGLHNYWVFCGEMAGFFRSSAAKYLAHWILEGDPGLDLSVLDVRRFDGETGQDYTVSRLRGGHIYSLPVYYPHSEPAGGRDVKRSPIHQELAARGAVFGVRNGWEVPNWFGRSGATERDVPSFEHANWFGAVSEECRAAQSGSALVDLTSLAKFKLSGAQSLQWLDDVAMRALPEVGNVALVPIVSPAGTVAASVLVSRVGETVCYLTDHAENAQRLASLFGCGAVNGDVNDCTNEVGVIGVMGPDSDRLLQSIMDSPARLGAMGRCRVEEMVMAGVSVTVLTVSTTGELGYELHHSLSDQQPLYAALLDAGSKLGTVDIGMRALDSMRLEKGRRWSGRDYGISADVDAAGLTACVDPSKSVRLGGDYRRVGELARSKTQPATLVIDTEGEPIAPWGEEPVWHRGEPITLTTTGGFGHRIDSAVALAVLPGGVDLSDEFEVEMFGKRYPATAFHQAPYDPKGDRLIA